jgi:hypothetical protein
VPLHVPEDRLDPAARHADLDIARPVLRRERMAPRTAPLHLVAHPVTPQKRPGTRPDIGAIGIKGGLITHHHIFQTKAFRL